MFYYLIDYENVSEEMLMKMQELKKDSLVYLFYSENGGKKISLDALEKIQGSGRRVQNIKVNAGTKNALDFQLSSYLGFLISKGSEKDDFIIISNDKGYDVVAKFWCDKKYKVSRMDVGLTKKVSTAKSEKSASTTNQKKSKVDKDDVATQGEVQKVLGKGYNFQAITEIVNQYKTKTAINSALIKFANKDTKKAGEIYQKLKPLLKEKHKS